MAAAILQEFGLEPWPSPVRDRWVWFGPGYGGNRHGDRDVLPEPWFTAVVRRCGQERLYPSWADHCRFPSEAAANAAALAAWSSMPEDDRAASRVALLGRALSDTL